MRRVNPCRSMVEVCFRRLLSNSETITPGLRLRRGLARGRSTNAGGMLRHIGAKPGFRLSPVMALPACSRLKAANGGSQQYGTKTTIMVR